MDNNPEFLRKWNRSLIFGGCLILVLFCLTAALASRIREVSVASPQAADVSQELPEFVGNWKGELIYYCQNEQCMRSYAARELTGLLVCPHCEGRLDKVSLAERTILPPDTVITRRLYQNDKNEHLTVTIVLSGNEQRSIHRPQQCLPAQGFAIERSTTLAVPLEGRLPVKLTLIRASQGMATQTRQAPSILMAYWFAGGGHETHDHFQRMGYMAWDNLVKGGRPRWAYVSVQTFANTGEKAAENRISQFVRQLYPLLKPGKLKPNIEQSTSNVQ